MRRTEPAHSPEARPVEHGHRIGKILNLAIIAALLLAVAVLGWQRHAQHASETSVATNAGPSGKSIAVLPFENLSADKDNEYFVAGMQDLILTRLADIGELKVISRTSTEKYKSRPDNLKQVAAELGVATILEGSVQRSGNAVLINVQLIDATTDIHLWAESHERALDNVFGVEGEVAGKIADALKAKLTPAETARVADKPTQNPAAYDLFLRAEYLASQGAMNYDTTSFKPAIALYQQAVQADPAFALAWARLSIVQSQLDWFFGGGLDTQRLKADARANAGQAASLQPKLADAHLALGLSNYWGRADYDCALNAFAAALKARPHDPDAMTATAFVLRRQGHYDAAITQLQSALERDPRNTIYAFELGATEAMAGRYAEAQHMLQRALALDPDNIQAKLQSSSLTLLNSGDIPRALNQAQGDSPQLTWQRVSLLTYQRDYRAAITLLDGIPDTSDNFIINGPKPYQLGNLYRLAGEDARAHTLFEQAQPWLHAQFAAQADSPINLGLLWSYRAGIQLDQGQMKDALDSIAKSQVRLVKSGDHVYGPQAMEFNATLYAQAGRADLAAPSLEKLFATPGSHYVYSPLILEIDPAWDPIRQDPQFQALLKKYADQFPASLPAATGGTS